MRWGGSSSSGWAIARAPRSAAAQKDDTQRAQLLRRAVLLFEALATEAAQSAAAHAGKIDSPVAPEEPRADALRASPAELDELLEEALRKLLNADGKDPV